MMLLAGLTFSCLFLNIQTQNSRPNGYYPYYQDPNNIYFPDRINVLPLSLATQTVQANSDVLKQIFGEPTKQSNAFSIKNNELIAPTMSDEQALAKDKVVSQAAQKQGVEQAVVVKPLDVQPNNINNGLLYSITNFGLNLLKRISAAQLGNVVVSPYSITSLLALLQQGAIGSTQEQISTALQLSPAASASAYLEISSDFKKRYSRNILKTASNVFVGDTFNLNNTFKKVAQANFDSDITSVSFAKPSEATRQINSWVASRTDNKIERLISSDSLHENTQVVLVNAIYFKGFWEVPFRAESTAPGQFHLSSGATKTVPFMRAKRLMKTGLDPTTNAQVILLPFERNQYSLMVILPSASGGITNMLTSLTDARLLSYLSFSLEDTDLEIPKFTVRADTDLALLLRDMGITKAFSPYSELNALGSYRVFSPQISTAVHSAVLSIDEQGGSAAAATAFAAVALSYDEPTTVPFKVDRPFIAILWDTASSLPLFIAKIEDPEQ